MNLFSVISVFSLPATSSTSIIPSYVWPLAYIYNKTIPVTPPLSVHGNVTKAAMGLFLDGKNSWIDAGDFTGRCYALFGGGKDVTIRKIFVLNLDLQS